MPVPPQDTADPTLAQVTAVLDDYFEHNIQQARSISPAYAFLWEELNRQTKAGGKRLRPRMVLLSYEAFAGKDIPSVAPVAAATELLHLCMLMHDDITDRDIIRRGVPNVIGVYREHYAALLTGDGERQHFAESSALLGGDALLSGAYQLINSAPIDPGIKQRVQVQLSHSIFEIIGGQLIDTEAAFRTSDKASPLTVARFKTAGYSFIAPLQIGALLAGATDTQLALVRDFGEQLGIAFQLQDDILGIFGDSKTLGKSTTGDIREGKHTYLVEYFFAHANKASQQEFTKNYGNPDLSESGARIVRDLLTTSGARTATEQKIQQLEAGAMRILGKLEFQAQYHDKFLDLVHKSLHRDL